MTITAIRTITCPNCGERLQITAGDYGDGEFERIDRAWKFCPNCRTLCRVEEDV